ncbi:MULTISPECIES: MarR family winged helix-turn-helix transcriptional regulator [unclassified Streptomyces]|uniref:MarR family winged helix-turn-helix transcriptional regulator n=1 Tax=unclassified Streptomyces TaxID=2593676 RepID=UPI0037004E92
MTAVEPACSEQSPSAARGGPVGMTLARVSRTHRIAMGRRLRELGLYPGQELMMMRLWDCGAVRQSELIQSLGLDPSTVTKMLQRLEQCGYVSRSPDPADRRAVLVEATERGQALRTGVEDAWTGLEESSLAGLEPAERTELARLLGVLAENLRAEADEAGDCPTLNC